MLAGCEQAEFGFKTNGRFSMPTVSEGTPAAACLAQLVSVDAQVKPDWAARRQVANLGEQSRLAFRTAERRRMRSWDEHFCHRQAECRKMATPGLSSVKVDETIEICLDERAQRRVRWKL
jgi:hypothetical protein